MSHQTAHPRPDLPSASERAMARLIVGLLLAITTPFLAPTALGAVWVAVALARSGYRAHAAAVFFVTAGALAVVAASHA
jgi:hypothetical protein